MIALYIKQVAERNSGDMNNQFIVLIAIFLANRTRVRISR